jgi:hypothetical protein
MAEDEIVASRDTDVTGDKFLWGFRHKSLKERDGSEDLNKNGKIILKYI